MSSYLLAWVVGELSFQETLLTREDSSHLKIRVYTPPNLIASGTYGLSIIKKVISYHEKNLGIPFPLPKLDYVAIPDFSAGKSKPQEEGMNIFGMKGSNPFFFFSIIRCHGELGFDSFKGCRYVVF